MLNQELWQTSPDGEFFSCENNLRIVIRRCGGYTRYVVLYRGTKDARHPEMLLGSGTESDLTTAMIAARRAATRIGFVLTQRLTTRTDRASRPGR